VWLEKTLTNRERTSWAWELGWGLSPYLFHFIHFKYIGLCVLLKANAEAFFIGKRARLLEGKNNAFSGDILSVFRTLNNCS
jgi:hypothetical protein